MIHNVVFKTEALGDLNWWAKIEPRIVVKILDLVENISRTPFEGLGKPEALKGNYRGFWSRRITGEHRLIYQVKDNSVIIISAKGHYD